MKLVFLVGVMECYFEISCPMYLKGKVKLDFFFW